MAYSGGKLGERDSIPIEIENGIIPRIIYTSIDITLKSRKNMPPINPKERRNTGKAIDAIETKLSGVDDKDINYVMYANNPERYARFLEDPDIRLCAAVTETMGLTDMHIFQMAMQAKSKGLPFLLYTAQPGSYDAINEHITSIFKKPDDLSDLTESIIEYFQKS